MGPRAGARVRAGARAGAGIEGLTRRSVTLALAGP